MPNRAIETTKGLLALCHSITGGRTGYQGKLSYILWDAHVIDVRQGFWVPFAAARAIAATFCFKIRHALTPVFGNDFVDLCLEPGHPKFQSYSISQSIVRQCARQAEQWKRLADSYKVQPSLSVSIPVREEVTCTTVSPTNACSTSNSDTTQRGRKRRRLWRSREHVYSQENVVAKAEAQQSAWRNQWSGPVEISIPKGSMSITPFVKEGAASVNDAALTLSRLTDAETFAVAEIMLEFRSGHG